MVFTYDDNSNISEIKGYYFTVFEHDGQHGEEAIPAIKKEGDIYKVSDTFITNRISKANPNPHFTFNVDPVSAPREPTEDEYKRYIKKLIGDIKNKTFKGNAPIGKKANLITWDNTLDKSKEPDLTDYHIEYLNHDVDPEDPVTRYFFINDLNDEDVQSGEKIIASYNNPGEGGWFHFKKTI